MKVLAFLIRTNVRKSVVIALLSALSGLGSAGLIATVTTALQHGGSALVRPSYLIALAFVAALAAKIGANLASNLMMGRFAQQSILDLCTGLCRKVIQAPLREIEVMGSATILTCLTEDVNVLTNSVQAIPLVLTNAVVLLGCAVYLAWMSWIAVVLLTLMMVIAGVCYRLLMRSAYPPIQRARLGKEKLFRHFRSLTDGIKELKIHRDRNEMFFREDIEAAAEHFRNENVVAMIRYARADAWSQMMFGLLLATLLFALPTTSWMTPDAITKYVFVTIYVMSPAWNLIRALPTFASGQVSLERMEELGLALDNVAPRVSGSIDLRDARRAATVTRSTPPLVEFRNVVFSYSEHTRENFTLGPLDLTLHPGEMLFIIGGNGSGKSSLVKLLTGLYTPESGEIYLNGRAVSDEQRDDYRQLFSVVYSDFFLFERLLGISSAHAEAGAKQYLHALDLANKVRIEGNSFSTTALSQGQRRRLALLAAYMEDRPIYVLDEWAADQDPAFRQVFYLKLLPELKSRGKTVVVVTHDDRYFHLGDRVIKLDCGKIVDAPQPEFSATR